MGVVFRRRARAQGSICVNRSVDFQGQEGGGEARAREYHVVLRQEIMSSGFIFWRQGEYSDALVDATYPISVHSTTFM